MSPLLYQLSYTARKDGTQSSSRIQEWFGECLARITPSARQVGLEALSSKFWVLSCPELTQNSALRTSRDTALSIRFPPVSPVSLESGIRHSHLGSVPLFR
jgi:hypothetical protein